MESLSLFIESGLLEMYVAGLCTTEEEVLVEQMIQQHPELATEINNISEALEACAVASAVAPDPIIKPFLFATIDYTERLKAGEQPSFPPELNENAALADYEPWLKRSDMILNNDFKDVQARIIGYTPQAITAIVWIKDMAPQEVHDNEYEKFLIVEGTCNITIGESIHSLVPGDYLAIPLHQHHHVKVTSLYPCKVILQRIAA